MRIALRTNLESAGCFHLPEEMSPRLRDYYDRTMERFSARPLNLGAQARAVIPKLSARVILNGEEFDSAGQMPPAYRRFYENLLAEALPLNRAVYTVARIEHSNFIKRTISLAIIAAGVTALIVYLWLQGFYS